MIVADTDVLIDFLQGKPPADARVALELERGHLATTTVNRFELLAGARSAKQQNLIKQLLDALPCLPLDSEAADQSAEIRRSLESSGEGIGMGDSLIAGIVLVRKGILLTRNVRHFARIPTLSLARLSE